MSEEKVKVKKPFYKKWWVWVIAIIVIANLGGGDEETNQTAQPAAQQTEATNQAQPAPAPVPAPVKEEAKPEEKPVELSNEGVASDVKISVLGFESVEKIGNNQFSTVEAQGIFKIVKVNVTNNQKDAITVDSNSYKLVDDQGREFSPSSEASLAFESSTGNAKRKTFLLQQLNPGLSIEGNLAYDVPKDAKGFVLKARGGMTGKEITLKVE
ncbi:DUF4352 domain-containing protein [Ammoniphilus sp. YIM 78166]|uniref:DUF4352 domain-containing protein n=1 Tax=Ammoniphilus sp. YIM 78166 TaxID=1644106 RepID=UPI001F0DBB75|nr:DUF4352 domain-containing protein [Ammoniphilus sp. YIM 78166]